MDQDDKLIELKLIEFLKKVYPKADRYFVRKTFRSNYEISAIFEGSYEDHSEDNILKKEVALQICELIKL